jgi:hypothetical protein
VSGFTRAAPPSTRPGPLTPSLAGNVVFAGDLVELTFVFPAGVRPDEWEAFLSLDGGESYPVRLTEERTPESTRLTARIPNLPTKAARILVRAGGEDEEGDRFEMDLAVSDCFQIAASAGRLDRLPWPDAGRLPRRGNLVQIEWIVEDSAVPEPPLAKPLPDGLSERGTAVGALFRSVLEAAIPRSDEVIGPGLSRLVSAVQRVRLQRPVDRVGAFSFPRFPPLRI